MKQPNASSTGGFWLSHDRTFARGIFTELFSLLTFNSVPIFFLISSTLVLPPPPLIFPLFLSPPQARSMCVYLRSKRACEGSKRSLPRAVWESGCQTCWHRSPGPHYRPHKPLNRPRGGRRGNHKQHFLFFSSSPLLLLRSSSFFIFFLPPHPSCCEWLARLFSYYWKVGLFGLGQQVTYNVKVLHANTTVDSRAYWAVVAVSRILPRVMRGRDGTFDPFFKRSKTVTTCTVTGLCKCSLSM